MARKVSSRSWSVSFDHAAVATREPHKLKHVLSILGLIDEGSEPVPSQGVVTHFLRPEPGVPMIEILEPTDPQGVIEKFLARKGPGIHHLSFRVTRLDELCVALRQENIRLVYDSPRPGAHHTRVNFIHPESCGGILIEISEKAS